MEAVLAYVSPAWVLALILAALNVLVFRVALGRPERSALYYAPFGVFGFAAGNLVAALVTSALPTLGDVHVIEASAGAWLCLSLANARLAT
jgi:hypothetical protein